MRDFLWALADRLRRIGPAGQDNSKGQTESRPVYFGRLLQGEKTPCFYLPPPALGRRILPCGRVRREINLELHYYPGRRQLAEGGLAEQQRMGENLARDMAELTGRLRGYRGHDLSWQAGNDCLRFRGRYVYYTTLELEAADGWGDLPEEAELMQYFAMK